MSETDFLKLKKHDNVETNTEKFDIENYLNGNWDKINENAKKTNNQILQLETEKTKLETELKEAKEDIYQNSIRGQASGEYIHVEDSSNCRAKIGIGGNSKQETSPSPDYPAEIKTVGSNVNLFNKETVTKGKYMMNGTIGTNSNYVYSDYIEIGANQDFIWNTSDGTIGTFISYYNSSKTYISGTSSVNNISKTTPENCKYIIVSFDMRFLDIAKIEKGKNITAYSPYGQGCVNEVICNDNLFNKDKAINGAFILADTGELSYNSNWNISEYIPVIAGKKYIVYGVVSTTAAFYDKNKKFIKTQSITRNNIIVATEEIKYIKIDVKNDYLNTAVIIEGTEEKGYIEHKSQTYTIPTQQEMLEGDYFDWDNEEEVHTWNKLVLDGTENWEYDSTYNYFKCPSYVFEQIPSTASGDGGKQLSNYFSVVGDWNTFKNNTNLNGFNPVSNLGYKLIIRNTNCRTIDTFKAWLKTLYNAGTPVMIYYKLKTPKRLKFTNDQKAVAKELNNARTYKNVTNIYSTDEISPIIDLDYAKDLETLLTSKESEV